MSNTNELEQLERRLLAIDTRLKQARRSRDEYIDFLRKKYPQWRPPDLPTYNSTRMLHTAPSATDYMERRPDKLIDQLATSKYHWDTNQRLLPRRTIPVDLEPNDPIPSSGPMLETDLPRIRRRLNEIAAHLRVLRDHRLHLSSVDFYRSTDPSVFAPSTSMAMIRSRQNNDLLELRKRINSIEPSAIPDAPEPNKADLDDLRAEQLIAKYRKEVNGEGDKRETHTDPPSKTELDHGNEPPTVLEEEPVIAPRRTIVFKGEVKAADEQPKQQAQPMPQPRKEAASKNSAMFPSSKTYENDLMMPSSEASPSYKKMLGLLKGGGTESSTDSDNVDVRIQSSAPQSKPTPSVSAPQPVMSVAEKTATAQSNTAVLAESAKSVGESFLSRILGETSKKQTHDNTSSSDDISDKVAPQEHDDSDSDFFS